MRTIRFPFLRSRQNARVLSALIFLSLPTLAQARFEQTITVDASRTFQTIDGFGTCLISWGKFPERTYDERLARLYADDMGLNILRCELSGGTQPTPVEPDDFDFRTFRMNGYSGRVDVFLDFAKKLKRVNPDMRIIGTVWSPPEWMKAHGQTTRGLYDPQLEGMNARNRLNLGNNALTYGRSQNYVTREHYPHFVAWLVEMARLFADNGTPLEAISAGNEVIFTQWFQSNIWTAEDYADIIVLLGEALDDAGKENILLFGPETMTGHNYSHGNPPFIAELTSGKARQHLDVWATHGYVDGHREDHSATSTAEFWATIEATGKPFWITEGGTGKHAWPEPLSGVAAAIHNSFVHGNASAFVPWQITEPKPTQHALMVNHELTKKSHAVRHFSKVIDRGAQRIQAKPSDDGVSASAYRHPESGQLSIVLINPKREDAEIELVLKNVPGLDRMTQFRTTEDEDFKDVGTVNVERDTLTVRMPAQSMVSLVGETATGPSAFATPAPEPIAPERVWTSSENPQQTVRASLLAVREDAVHLRMMPSGRDVWVTLDKFSETDRAWVASVAP